MGMGSLLGFQTKLASLTKSPANSIRNRLVCQGRGRLLWLAGLIMLLSLLSIAAGPPVLTGSQPGSLRLYPKQIAAQQAAQRLPALSAPAALLADSDTQHVLLALNPTQPRPMASTTKLMTALLAVENAGLDEVVVVSPEALSVGEASMGLQAGEQLTVDDLLWGLLLNSGNDAAMALAGHVSGNEAAFVALMNQEAAALGLTNTRYANPHGLDAPEHYSSAHDLWRLGERVLAQPRLREMVATPTYTAAGHGLWNRNELLGLYPGADGAKTGTSDLAGQCLVASVTRDGHRVMAVVLGSQDRYTDVIALFDHYFSAYRWDAAPQPQGLTAWVQAADGRPYLVTAADPPDIFLPDWQWPLLRTQPILAPTSAESGPPAGVIRWYLANDLLAEAPATLIAY